MLQDVQWALQHVPFGPGVLLPRLFSSSFGTDRHLRSGPASPPATHKCALPRAPADSPVGAFDECVALAGLAWNFPTSCAWAARVYVNDRWAAATHVPVAADKESASGMADVAGWQLLFCLHSVLACATETCGLSVTAKLHSMGKHRLFVTSALQRCARPWHCVGGPAQPHGQLQGPATTGAAGWWRR